MIFAVIFLHLVALCVLLLPLWLEMRTPGRQAYTTDTQVLRRSRISYYIAIPLFVTCVVIDVVIFHIFSNAGLIAAAIWVAVEVYWFVIFGMNFLKKSR